MSDPSDDRLGAYLALSRTRPDDFTGPADGVRIALDPVEIRAIEAEVALRYAEKGWPAEWAEAGLSYRDPYLSLLRDAVVFPGGRVGIHHRVLSNSEPSGAAVLPLLGDRIVLIRHFRHPSRRWHWEIPRGGVEPGQRADETARAELREEIGAEIEELTVLGRVHGSTALISGSVELFLGRISNIGTPQIEEGIAAIRAFSLSEIEAMITASEITDSFTLAAFLQARLRGLI
jgi:ADP-ribose pyrophosphatase